MVNLARKVGPPYRVAAAQGRSGPSSSTSLKARLAVRLPLYWMAIAALLAVGDAIISIWPTASSLTAADRNGVRFNLLVIAFALVLSVGIGIVRPGWWRRAMAILAVAPVPILLVTSRNVAAGCATLLLAFVASWLGRELARKAFGTLGLVTGWILGATFGLDLIAAYGFSAGMLGLLRPYTTWPLLAIYTLALVVKARTSLQREARAVALWLARPTRHGRAIAR